VISFGGGQVFSTNPLISFSSKLLCDFPIIYGLFFSQLGRTYCSC